MNEIKELTQQLANTPAEVKNLLADLSYSQLVAKDGDDFSILENICHLRDIEAEGYSVRIHRILNEDDPSLEDIDGSRLAIERDYQRQNLAEALDAFARARAENVSMLQTVTSTAVQRTGKLEGVGPINLERLIEMMVEHDQGHVDDLRSSRRLVGVV